MESAEAQLLIDEVDELLGPIRQKGYDVTFGSCRFDEFGCYLNLSIKQSGSDERRVNRYLLKVGLDDVLYGSIVEIDGTQYKIVDVNERAPQYPIVVESRSGSLYKFSLATIREARVVRY